MATQLDSGSPASARPTGTVTFLFSDIEGSTVRWERDRKAMAAALARHDALLHRAVEARGAYVFKTIGDAFCDGLHNAARCPCRRARRPAVAWHAKTSRRSRDCACAWRCTRARSCRLERDGDYFGPTVNRIARLLARSGLRRPDAAPRGLARN